MFYKQLKLIALIIIQGILSSFINLKAQSLPVDPKNMLKTITPTSPDVTTLGRYGMQAPSLSTGSPQQTIPLFEIKENGLTYGVDLFYNYSGLRVKEDASMEGLGWGLTEGTIIRIVKHIPDEHNLLKKFEDFGDNLNEEFGKGYVSYYNYCMQVIADQDYNLTQNRLFYKLYDAQPDIYVYSFKGYNGKFLWINNHAINLEHNDIIIERDQTSNKFTLTTPDGIQYIFNEADKVWTTPAPTTRPSVCPNCDGVETYADYGYTTTWRLSEITNTATKAKISFTFESNVTSQVKDIDQISSLTIISPNQFDNFIPTTYSKDETYVKTINENYYTKEINSDNYKILFIAKSRSDGGQYALDEIRIYNKLNLNQAIKTIKFTHEYFGNTSTPETCWLKLKKLKITGEGTNSEFMFSYVNESFTSPNLKKNGLSIDHWGYFNNSTNTTLIPLTGSLQAELGNLGNVIPWANREPNIVFTKLFALETTTYPTKGYTKINYELADGRGIRVVSLEDFDGEKNNSRYYDYHTQPTFTVIPDYSYSEYYTYQCCNEQANPVTRYVTFSGYTYGSLDFLESTQNFYDYVTEYYGSPDGKAGRTDYKFIKFYGYSDKVLLTEKNSYKYGDINPTSSEIYYYNFQNLRNIYYWNIPIMTSTGTSTGSCHYDIGDQERPSCCPSDPLNGLHYILGDFSGGTNYTNAVWITLDSTKSVTDNVISIKKMFYENIGTDGIPMHTSPIRLEETNSNGKNKVQELFYAGDKDPDNLTSILGIPQMYDFLNYKKHLITPVIKAKTYLNNNLISKEYNQFSYDNNGLILRTSYEQWPNGTESGKIKWNLAYDNKANLINIVKENDITSSYLWGYNQTYPVAKIEGADYATASAVVNLSILNSPTSDAALRTELAKLRTSLPNALVTTYTYQPLVGMTSSTDPTGVTTYYEYDDFGRLKCIRDDDGRILKTYEYHYKQ